MRAPLPRRRGHCFLLLKWGTKDHNQYISNKTCTGMAYNVGVRRGVGTRKTNGCAYPNAVPQYRRTAVLSHAQATPFGPSVVVYGPSVQQHPSHHCQLLLLVLLHPPYDARQLFRGALAAQESPLLRKEEGGKKCESHQKSAERGKKKGNPGRRNQPSAKPCIAVVRTSCAWEHALVLGKCSGFGSSLLRKGQTEGQTRRPPGHRKRTDRGRYCCRRTRSTWAKGVPIPCVGPRPRRQNNNRGRKERGKRRSSKRYLGWDTRVGSDHDTSPCPPGGEMCAPRPPPPSPSRVSPRWR